MNNHIGKADPEPTQYEAMAEIYTYFNCKNMSDLLHLYTLEDGMLLALIMSNIFERMNEALGLDPTNFASTAKYSYIACKRLMNINMQTIPNARVFNAIVEMKRAGFSIIKKQVSLASPLNDHVQECQFNPDCEKCGPFVLPIEKSDVVELKKETLQVIKDCKHRLEETLNLLKEQHEEDEIEREAVGSCRESHPNLREHQSERNGHCGK